MFQFDPANYGHDGVVDQERNASFKDVGGIPYSSEAAALLTWSGREIPLNYDSNHPADPETGDQYTQFWLNSFGSSYEVDARRGIGAYAFRDEAEQAQARMLAVEALLVSYFRYAPVPWDARKCSVVVDGNEWRISAFPGYPAVAGDDC